MPPPGSFAELVRYALWQRLYRLSLRRGWRYGARFVAQEWVSPRDWAIVRVPDSLFWLYAALRPFGWIVRRWPR
jgi:hypothetical protein